MADETERIEREIAHAREDLAKTLDQLADRANPQRLADDAKGKAVAIFNKPAVRYTVAGVGVLVVFLVVRKIVR